MMRVVEGALLEALDSPHLGHVLSVGRRELARTHAKLEQLVHDDFLNFAPIAERLAGFDACFGASGSRRPGSTRPRICA